MSASESFHDETYSWVRHWFKRSTGGEKMELKAETCTTLPTPEQFQFHRKKKGKKKLPTRLQSECVEFHIGTRLELHLNSVVRWAIWSSMYTGEDTYLSKQNDAWPAWKLINRNHAQACIFVVWLRKQKQIGWTFRPHKLTIYEE